MGDLPPRETDLAHNAPDDRFAAAMAFCQDASGACVHKGRCTFDGSCFEATWSAARRARKAIRRAAQGQPEDVRHAMLMAANLVVEGAVARAAGPAPGGEGR